MSSGPSARSILHEEELKLRRRGRALHHHKLPKGTSKVEFLDSSVQQITRIIHRRLGVLGCRG